MISRVAYDKIDFEKYEACIENSEQKNYYATAKILDEICDCWEVLVFKDYEAVMPVPFKRYFGLKIVVAPMFTQQLGVFSNKDSDVKPELFYNYLIKKYPVHYYPFNSFNSFKVSISTRKNYVIQQSDSTHLKKKYSKGRKSDLKKAQLKLNFKTETDLGATQEFLDSHILGFNNSKEVEEFKNFLNYLEKEKQLIIAAVYSDETRISLAFLINEKKSLILLALINDKSLQSLNGASVLIDQLLKLYIDSKAFDFMGGNVRGIEVFFKSFGAEMQNYEIIQNSRGVLLKNYITSCTVRFRNIFKK